MKIKLLVLVSVLALLAVIGGSYFSSKGKLYVDITNVPADTMLTLKIHEANKDTVSKPVKNKSTVVLGNGTHIVSITKGMDNFVGVASVPSFYRSATLSGEIKNEQKRTFVGTNPSPCMMYIANTFYSMACGEGANMIQQQVVPTLSSPGYTRAPSTELLGTILGISATRSATYALVENYADDETLRQLVQLGSGLSIAKNITIPNIITDTFTMTSSADKVLIFSRITRVGYLYTESTGSMQKITLPEAEESFELVDVSIADQAIVTTYSDSEENDGLEGETATGRSIIFVQNPDGQAAKYETSDVYSRVAYCKPSTVCAVGAYGLDIYSVGGSTLKKVATLPGVKDMFNYGDSVRFINDTGVMLFDPASLTGYYEYAVGAYTGCGVNVTVGGYLVCAIDTNSQKHALFVSATTKAGVDDVDKKVIELLKSNYVSGVAAVSNYIYVIPDYGDVDIFTKDPETTARVNQAIENVIRRSTIPKQQYFVINAGEPL